MYGLRDLQSTPVASKYPSIIRKASSQDLPTNIFDHSISSDGDASVLLHNYSFYDDSSMNALSGFFLTCRHSPRLLTNGYYLMDEDSFRSSKEGNITLSPTKTSVSYKESIVRIFRRRKRKISKSLASIFGMKQPDPIVQSDALSDMDLPLEDEPHFEDDEDSFQDNNFSITHGQRSPFEGEQRSVKMPVISSKNRVSSGGFLILNGDNCEFSCDQRLWASQQIPTSNTMRSPRHFKVLNPLHMTHNQLQTQQKLTPGYFCERKVKDFRTNISRSPIYLIVMILVGLVICVWTI